MKQKNIYKHWLLPELGLQNAIPDLHLWNDRPTGNSCEMNPMDETLNRDVYAAVQYHVFLTNHLDGDDERKFSMETPSEGSCAYLRVWDPTTGGCPSSERIIQDVEKVLVSLQKIHKAEGTIVDDVGIRTGSRYINQKEKIPGKSGSKNNKRKRAKDDYSRNGKGTVDWTHKDLDHVTGDRVQESVLKFENKNMKKKKEGDNDTNNNRAIL